MAQDEEKWGTEEGELEDVTIEIVRERQITLPKANRNFEKVPPRPAENIKPPITYDFRAFSFQTPQINPVIKPLKLKQDNPSKVYASTVSAGFGNYATPFLEAFINSGRDRNKLLGAHAYLNRSFRGPVDGARSGSGMYGLSFYGQSFSNTFALSGNLGFDNRSTHFYGYAPGEEKDASDIRQSVSIFRLGAGVANARNSNFSYKLTAGFSYLFDNYQARETEVDLDLNSYYKIDDQKRIRIKAGYYIVSRKDDDVEAKPRNLFTVNPAYEFAPMDELKLSAGAVIAFEDDTLGSKDVHVYPDFSATYAISPSVDLTGALSGGIEKVSLQTLTNENLWLAPNVPIYHTNKIYDVQFGVNAKLGNKVSASGGFAFANLKNWYFFRNDSSATGDQAKFVVDYDTDATRRTNLFVALSYTQAELAKFMLRGDLFGYSTSKLDDAWHRPTYRLTANASYNLYQKMLFKLDIITQGGIKAPDPVTREVVKLNPAFDLNFRAEYLFSESLSFFLQFNNITSTKYQSYLNYPVRGFQVLGGVTWSF